MSEMIITSKLDGKDISLKLTQKEVESAISICEQSSIEEIIVMKFPHKGGALFFTDKVRAAACQDRHRFEHSFTVKLSALKKYDPKAAPAPKVDKGAQALEDLKAEVVKMREENEKGNAAIKLVEDKDTEIEILKEDVVKAGNAATALTKEVEKVNKLNESQTETVNSLTEANAKLVEENTKLKK